MRIIAGVRRGMVLSCPDTLETRPITDRIKESLFNVLATYDLLAGRVVADLFCGVGSLGLEAISRWAAFATFVEQSSNIAPYLEKNIVKAGFAAQAKVVRSDAFVVGAPGRKHDLVFVDPPYATTREAGENSPLGRLFATLARQTSEGGVVVLRTEREIVTPDVYGPFQKADERLWGSMAIRLYMAKTPEAPPEPASPGEGPAHE